MKCKKITLLDDCRLSEQAIENIAKFSTEPIAVYKDTPSSKKDILERIAGADCVLVSSRTRIDADIIEASTSLQYIGMCCSLYDAKSANVDIAAAVKHGITVKGVRDYGDEGTVEFLFAQLIYLCKGLGVKKWRSENSELKNKSIGIIGLGTLGQMVAKTAAHFGMQVFYFSRTRKQALENEHLQFLPLQELLAHCDVVTTHVPKHTILLTEKEFRIKKKNSILINTSLGLTFEKQAFLQWLSADNTSFAIFDGDGAGIHYPEFQHIENIILSDSSAGFTIEAKQRLSEKVLDNLVSYLSEKGKQ